jgi:CBS domain-containing protein
MTPDPKTLPPNANVQRAAEVMRDYEVGSVPVVDQMGSLVGIITDRDIAVKVVAKGLDSGTRIEDVMTRQPVSAPADTPIEQAIHVMSTHKIRRLPIVAYGKLIGIIALADIATSTANLEEKAESLIGVSECGYDRGNADIRAISQY